MKLHRNIDDVANYLNCLAVLEEETASFYLSFADKVELPLVKSMMLQIALDSQKHSVILEGIAQSISISKKKNKSCGKNFKQALDTISSLNREIQKKTKITEVDYASVEDELTLLESTLGEEYSIIVNLDTLRLMSVKIFQVYKLDLGNLGTTFLNIIRDEDKHRSLLADIRRIFLAKQKEEVDNTPIVKYQNPDAWMRY